MSSGQHGFKSGEKSKSLRAKLFKRDGLNCQICHKPLPKRQYNGNIEIDHKLPWSRGGATIVRNLRLAHKRCNRFRRASSVVELVNDGIVDEYDGVDYDDSEGGGIVMVVESPSETRTCVVKKCKRRMIIKRERHLIDVDSPMDDLSEGQLAEYMAAENGDDVAGENWTETVTTGTCPVHGVVYEKVSES